MCWKDFSQIFDKRFKLNFRFNYNIILALIFIDIMKNTEDPFKNNRTIRNKPQISRDQDIDVNLNDTRNKKEEYKEKIQEGLKGLFENKNTIAKVSVKVSSNLCELITIIKCLSFFNFSGKTKI